MLVSVGIITPISLRCQLIDLLCQVWGLRVAGPADPWPPASRAADQPAPPPGQSRRPAPAPPGARSHAKSSSLMSKCLVWTLGEQWRVPPDRGERGAGEGMLVQVHTPHRGHVEHPRDDAHQCGQGDLCEDNHQGARHLLHLHCGPLPQWVL